jgi:ketosteroid isomerase-like protein
MEVNKTNDGLIINPYKIIVRQKILKSFIELNKFNSTELLNSLSKNATYIFEGDNSLGGQRNSKIGIDKWFQRLFRLLPGQFEVLSIIIKGVPWDTDAIVEFKDYVKPQFGEPYTNYGVQRIKLKFGKITHIHTYVDTEKITRALNELAKNGIEEAKAKQITE